MPKINEEEYEILKGLDEKWKWIARDEDDFLYVYEEKPCKSENIWMWWGNSSIDQIFEPLFQFIEWEDESPYNITELIEEYEINRVDEVLKRMDVPTSVIEDVSESEETEVKNIEWAKEKLFERAWEENKAEYLIHLKDVYEVIDQLDEPEHKNITLQDITHRLWELPLNNRKYWLEQLKDDFQEGYIVPLGLKTTDGEEQYLTLNGSYFASRRNRYLQQTFATLEEIPEFYRELAERVL